MAGEARTIQPGAVFQLSTPSSVVAIGLLEEARMKDWLIEKLMGVGMIILVVTMAAMVNGGSAQADPLWFVAVLAEKLVTNLVLVVGLGFALLVKWLGWVLIPLGLVFGCWLAGQAVPERLTVGVTRDEDGFPTVYWREPRYESWRWLFKSYTVESRCWLRATPEYWLFCVQVTAPWYRDDNSHYVEVLFRNIAGFSVTDADTLYGTGGTRSDELYSQQLVVRVDLYESQNGAPVLPLTLTCAPRVEVEALHQALANNFSVAALAPAFAVWVDRHDQLVRGRQQADQRIPWF